ncbi:hypothetical protein LWI29_030445 [Acer saccharum]|uniref:Uncharacterized protein n=1 Tax=Acer saccharum TaxID=4024 RepID=A0AA39WB42_ACESA|nr:hypothetical protein LWI29_030445 [Acer saccharum]
MPKEYTRHEVGVAFHFQILLMAVDIVRPKFGFLDCTNNSSNTGTPRSFDSDHKSNIRIRFRIHKVDINVSCFCYLEF